MKSFNIYRENNVTDKFTNIKKVVEFKSKINIYVTKNSYLTLFKTLGQKTSSAKRLESAIKIYYYIEYLSQIKGIHLITQEYLAQKASCSRKTVNEIIDLLNSLCYLELDYSDRINAIMKDNYKKPIRYYVYPISSDNVDSYSKPDKDCVKITYPVLVKNTVKENKLLTGGDISLYYCNQNSSNSLITKESNGTKSLENIDFPVYIAPYEELELRLPGNYRFLNNDFEEFLIWTKNHNNPARVTKSSRLYHPFHNLPKRLRKYIYYHNSPLVEIFDLHNCFYVLLCFLLKGNISDEEYTKYRDLVYSGKFYEEVAKNTKKSFYINFPSLAREAVKLELQAYRNLTISQNLAHGQQFVLLDKFFQNNFPEIREFLDKYPRENRSKNLQKDMCMIETKVFSNICNDLKNEGLTVFSLHDGIYASEEEYHSNNYSKMLSDLVEKHIFKLL